MMFTNCCKKSIIAGTIATALGLTIFFMGVALAQDPNVPAYQRSAFPHWQVRSCRAANHDALARWASSPVEWRTERECRIENDTGEWFGLYGGDTFDHYRELDVDHVIALNWAWQNGAWQWSRDRRREFANDPANLIPVSSRLNRQKGAKGPLEWLPPRTEFHCEYVLRFVYVANKYDLPVSSELGELMGQICFNTGE